MSRIGGCSKHQHTGTTRHDDDDDDDDDDDELEN
jgi:hypothetical protein